MQHQFLCLALDQTPHPIVPLALDRTLPHPLSGIGPESTPLSPPGTGQDPTTLQANLPEYPVVKGPKNLKLTLRRKSQKD